MLMYSNYFNTWKVEAGTLLYIHANLVYLNIVADLAKLVYPNSQRDWSTE